MPEATECSVDLHGHHPDDFCGEPLTKIVQQAWEMGAISLRLIHGHGRNRGLTPGFVNTNTGYFGLCVRSKLRWGAARIIETRTYSNGCGRTARQAAVLRGEVRGR
jgi:hypothetical protein